MACIAFPPMNHSTQFYMHDVPTTSPTLPRCFPNLCTCQTHSCCQLSLPAKLRRYCCHHPPDNLTHCQRKLPLHCITIRPPTAANPHLCDIQLHPCTHPHQSPACLVHACPYCLASHSTVSLTSNRALFSFALSSVHH